MSIKAHWQREPGDLRSACGRRRTVKVSQLDPYMQRDIRDVDCAKCLDCYVARQEREGGDA